MATRVVERGRTASAARAQSSKRPSRFTFAGRMMTPALVVLALLSIFPFIYIVLMSLSRVGLIGGIDLHWAGLDNWTRLFTDESVGAAWIRSIVYFVLTVGLEMTLGIGFALLVHSMVWGKNLVTSLLLMPMFMAPAMASTRRRRTARPGRSSTRPPSGSRTTPRTTSRTATATRPSSTTR